MKALVCPANSLKRLKVLVCGGRFYSDIDRFNAVLDEIHSKTPIYWIVEGGATGADSLARVWGWRNKAKVETYYPDWLRHGKSAGPMRNQAMLEGNPDIGLVIAFPGGIGTADMVKRAKQAKIKVIEV